jgi:dihydrofolate reductase
MDKKSGISAIIAVNNRNYIGLSGGLPWYNKEDLKHFKEKTKGGVLLVGFNTYIKLPKLQDRNIVVDYRGDELVDIEKIDWCIGGKKTYEKYAPYITELHISFINNDDKGDVMWPNFKYLNPNCKFFHYFFDY